MAKWTLKKVNVNINKISETFKVSKVMAVILANRGIRSKSQGMKFLNPKLNFQYNPLLMKDMEKAVQIVSDAVKAAEKIAVYGDYDVDGVMSTVILYQSLNALGANVIYYIPEREKEGYGLNMAAVKKLHELGVKLLLTCDNGISANSEVACAKNLGMKVVIVDHHEASEELPCADALVDPKQPSCEYPFKALCAGGLAYKFSSQLYEYSSADYTLHDDHLIFCAMATLCDIVDLQDENRIFVKNGLRLINEGALKNKGLSALLEVKKLSGKQLAPYDIGYILGPCINAAGRLETALTAAELFITDDTERALELAGKLSSLNDERKRITEDAVSIALEKLKPHENDPVLVLYAPSVHESIAGIVAGKIKENTYKPTLMITKGADLAKGSARSIEAYDIFQELYACRDLFVKFGGHKMAAGFSLEEKDIPELRRRLIENCKLIEEDFNEHIRIDKEISLADVTYELACELKYLEPFGKENPEPLFGTKHVKVRQIDLLGENKKAVRFTLEAGDTARTLKAISFNTYDKLKLFLENKYSVQAAENILADGKNLYLEMDFVYAIDINEYKGNVSVQLKVKDFR